MVLSEVPTSTFVPPYDEGNRLPSPSDSISDTPITSFEFPTVKVSPHSEEEITEQAQYDDDRPWEREETHGNQSGSGEGGGSYHDEGSGYQEEHNQAKSPNSYDHSLYDNKKSVRSHSTEKTRSSADPGSQERNDGWTEVSPSAIGHDPDLLPLRQYSTQQPLSTVSAIPPYPHVSEVVPHWSQYADPHANPVTAFCKALARGQCFQGENCLFRHSLTPVEYTLLFKDPQPNLWTLDVRAKRSVHPRIEATTPVEQTRALTVPLIAKVCTFYPLGKCRNGEACPYAHVDSAPSPFAINGTQNDSNSYYQQPPNKAPPPMACKFFFGPRGYCGAAENCPFSHVAVKDDDAGRSESYEANEAEQKDDDGSGTGSDDYGGWGTTTAPDWSQVVLDEPRENKFSGAFSSGRKTNTCRGYGLGRCNRGDSCRFSHDLEWDEPARVEPKPEEADDSDWGPMDCDHTAAPWAAAKPESCPHFAKGQCRNGDGYRYKHEDPIENSGRQTPRAVTLHKEEEILLEYVDDPMQNHDIEDQLEDHSSSGSSSQTHETDTNGSSEPKETAAQWHSRSGEAGQQKEDVIADQNKATWATQWPAEELPPEPEKFDAPCKYFGQGHCAAGDRCKYRHIPVPDPYSDTRGPSLDIHSPTVNVNGVQTNFHIQHTHSEDPIGEEIDGSSRKAEEEIVYKHPLVERSIYNCTIKFAADLTPEYVTTASESWRVVLSNLPSDINPSEIEDLAGSFDNIEEIIGLDDTEE
ncbi:hypothetical protein BDQ12DRAFT_722940 [Crucibulum laeve]|uniref:C3H1-type domain-containing protein n=1 Tax=Crucibulum laeve TaxID=68775 RepID=A0A5C3M1L3_9AGAR|nr:hypothetical protein BDQ12DRAFT_722940 [Crucibulum laeve]